MANCFDCGAKLDDVPSLDTDGATVVCRRHYLSSISTMRNGTLTSGGNLPTPTDGGFRMPDGSRFMWLNPVRIG